MFSKGARDVAKGPAFLHTNDIVHRDLKPGNILVSTRTLHEQDRQSE